MLRGLLIGLVLAAVTTPAPAARRKETLLYSRFDVDPGERRYFEFPSKVGEARLEVRFDVASPRDGPGIRATVLSATEYEKFRDRLPHEPLQATTYRRTGSLSVHLTQPGGYVVVVENQEEAKRRCRVDLEVTLTTGPDPESLPVAYASPRKRLIVVTVSLAGFAVIAGLAGRALWRATRRPRTAFWV
jgi:hypothetical protein